MISGIAARVRSLWNGIRRREDVDSDMSEEFRLHRELRTADLVRWGLTPAEAARQAKLEFGSAERYRDEGRASRGLRRVDDLRVSWLDFKLGFRMLARYPGLTLVGGLAMAFAIWVGAATFELVTRVVNPTLPLNEGDRIVGLRSWDAQKNRQERRALHDFETWRAELKSVQEMGAFRTVERNLILGDGVGEPVAVAEISASAFRVTRVPPLLGRGLVDEDEQPGASPVVVIGHEVWQNRFAGDSGVVGRSVRLGRMQTTIVGVMPEGYAFPVSESLWIPFSLSARDYARREGPSIMMFGRLAPGASFEEAQAELTAIGRRTAADSPHTHEHLRPQVMPFAKSLLDVSGWLLAAALSANLPVIMLLVLICGNVALLMFARAATRETEIAVRNALGASRSRIIMQLFAEALVLGSLAAVVGLAATGLGLRWIMTVVESDAMFGGPLPFWFDADLSASTVLYAAILTVMGALIAGVVPALKVTRSMGQRLQQSSAGAGGLRFGGVWTAVIISQVAVTVAAPVITYMVREDALRIRAIEADFPAQEFLSMRAEMDLATPSEGTADTSAAAFRERYRATYEELESRLASDPSVVGVTYADRLPRMYHPHRIIEIDAGPAAPRNPDYPEGYRVSSASVALDYFDVLGTPVLTGRGFHAGDLGSGVTTVLVNQKFVRMVLGESNPVGRRFRYIHLEEATVPREEEKPSEWYEIVGVVENLGMAASGDPKAAGIYHAAAPGAVFPMQLAVRVRGDPQPFVPRLRAVATATDPTLRLYDIKRLDEASLSELAFYAFWFRFLMGASGVTLVLSLAGIYAVMAFTVARRTREIGIRVALGANPRRVVLAIFKRPLIQVGLGVLAGAALLIGLSSTEGWPSVRTVGSILTFAAMTMCVCLLACIVPTRRALRVQPTEALRSDG